VAAIPAAAGRLPAAANDTSTIHRDSLDVVLVRVWLAVIVFLGTQWTWLCIVESPPVPVLVLSGAFLLLQLAGIVVVLRDIRRAALVTLVQLGLALATAVTILAMIGPADIYGRHGAVGDGLIVLIEPTLSAYVGFGPRLRLINPCTVLCVASSGLAYITRRYGVHAGYIPFEQGISALGYLLMVWGVTRFLRRGAHQADDLSEQTSRLSARRKADEAALVAEEHAVTMVHDQVLHGLLALAQPDRQIRSARTDQLIDSAIAGLSRLDADLESDKPPVDVVARLRAEIAEWSAILPVAIDGAESGLAPADVAEAFIDATRECLRNVEQHARAQHVAVSVTSGRFLRVKVRDDGLGFQVGDGTPGHYGIERSVIGRLRMVGGTAIVDSGQGAGTTVTMEWTPLELADAPADFAPGVTQWSWVSRLGLSPRIIWLTYFAPELIVTASLAVLHLPDARSKSIAISVLVMQFAVSAFGARAAAHLTLSRGAALLLFIANASLVTLGLNAMRAGVQDGYAYWAVGGAVNGAMVIALLRPFRESALATIALIAITDISVTHSSPGGTIGVNAIIVLGVAVALLHRRAFSRLSLVSEDYLIRLAEARAVTERRRAIGAVERRRIGPVRRRVLPFLIAVRNRNAADDADTDVMLTAISLGRWARQHLSHPDFFDDEIGEVLAAATKRGVTVDVSGDSPRGHAVELSRRALAIALGESRVRDIRISFVASPSGDTDMSIALFSESAISAEVPAQLSALDPGMLITAAERVLVAHWEPASAGQRRISGPSGAP